MATEAAAGLRGPRHGPASGAAPKQLIVLCHGINNNGQQLLQYAPHAAAALPDALFVAPNAPEETPSGHRWFAIQGKSKHELVQGLRRGSAALNRFVDAELDRYGLPATACALVGFSQGAMVALHAGLRRWPAPFAVAALSGGLFDDETLAEERRNDGPVLLAHGEADGWVPADWSRIAEAALRKLGVSVEALYVPGLDHNVNGAVLERLQAFLRAHAPG